MISENLIVFDDHDGERYHSVGIVFYDIIPEETLFLISNEVERILDESPDEDTTSFNLLVDGQVRLNFPFRSMTLPIQSEIFNRLISWISYLSRSQVTKITCNSINSDRVDTRPDESCYILTLYGDDWVGTYLSIEYKDCQTRKHTKSEKLYPDEREENQHYYDGGCLIINPANGMHRTISATNCLVFHVE